MSTIKKPAALVTGVSSGFGKAIILSSIANRIEGVGTGRRATSETRLRYHVGPLAKRLALSARSSFLAVIACGLVLASCASTVNHSGQSVGYAPAGSLTTPDNRNSDAKKIGKTANADISDKSSWGSLANISSLAFGFH